MVPMQLDSHERVRVYTWFATSLSNMIELAVFNVMSHKLELNIFVLVRQFSVMDCDQLKHLVS